MEEIERDEMEADILIVGAGPAGLAAAIRLGQLLKEHNERVEAGELLGEPLEPDIFLLEKSAEIGMHGFSGAVLDPRALSELLPDYIAKGCPLEHRVVYDAVYWLGKKSARKLPYVPPVLHNEGNYVVSLGNMMRWMGEYVEENFEDINLMTGFPGRSVLFDEQGVRGVRTADAGVDRHGAQKGNFEPGTDIISKVTIFAEGPRGSLCKEIMPRLGLLEGRDPQMYSSGCKELWKLPAEKARPAGTIYHTMGYPLRSDTFGGGFIYFMSENRVAVGFVSGLDSPDPFLDPHGNLQRYKQHPFVAEMLEGGELLAYGAKALTDGGWFSTPRLHAKGALLTGDTAGLLNPARLKGIHLAMKSGMLAAEAAFDMLLADDFSEASAQRYSDMVEKSWIKEELWEVRHFRMSFRNGFLPGLLRSGIQFQTGGRWPGKRPKANPDYLHYTRPEEYYNDKRTFEPVSYDGKLSFDKLTDVYYSGTKHEEDQVCHLTITDHDICNNRCTVEYQNPCQHFCPAQVYEMVEVSEGSERKELKINASNCVHCKTCDIRDPYQIINWVTPEGGGGPNYVAL